MLCIGSASILIQQTVAFLQFRIVGKLAFLCWGTKVVTIQQACSPRPRDNGRISMQIGSTHDG